MTEAAILLELKARFSAHMCFPNVYMCGGEMDMAVVTTKNLLWEIEVKLTMSDWNADRAKKKWVHPDRRHVARMFYVVPTELADKIPFWVPKTTGVLEARATPNGLRISGPRRHAKLLHKTPIGDAQMRHLLESTYHRFWRERSLRYHRQPEEARL